MRVIARTLDYSRHSMSSKKKHNFYPIFTFAKPSAKKRQGSVCGVKETLSDIIDILNNLIAVLDKLNWNKCLKVISLSALCVPMIGDMFIRWARIHQNSHRDGFDKRHWIGVDSMRSMRAGCEIWSRHLVFAVKVTPLNVSQISFLVLRSVSFSLLRQSSVHN